MLFAFGGGALAPGGLLGAPPGTARWKDGDLGVELLLCFRTFGFEGTKGGG